MLVFKYSYAGTHPATCGIGTQRSRCTLNAGYFGWGRVFFPTSPLLPPHPQTLSWGAVEIFGPDPQRQFLPSGLINARLRRDKGTDGLRDIFVGHVYTMWHLPLSPTLEAMDS